MLYFKYWQTYLKTKKLYNPPKKIRKEERNRKKRNTHTKRKQALDSQYVPQHHSSFSNAIKKDFMRYFQKQPRNMFCKKRCSKTFCKFHRKTPMLQSLFNNVAGLQACIFIKKRLQHKCFPVNIAIFLRTPILKYICKRLILYFLKSKLQII